YPRLGGLSTFNADPVMAWLRRVLRQQLIGMARHGFHTARIGRLPERLKCRAILSRHERAAHRYVGRRAVCRCEEPSSTCSRPDYSRHYVPTEDHSLLPSFWLSDRSALRQQAFPTTMLASTLEFEG